MNKKKQKTVITVTEVKNTYTNPKFGNIVAYTDCDSNLWFVADDVAKLLGYKNPTVTISKKVSDEDKAIAVISGQDVALVNESGFYTLVMTSRLPVAKQSVRWITNDVLPTINKTGLYATISTLNNMTSDHNFLTRVMDLLKDERDRRVISAENSMVMTNTYNHYQHQVPLIQNEKQDTHIQTLQPENYVTMCMESLFDKD